MRLQLLDDLFQPLLEVAAIAGAGQQRPHVEAVDGGAFQHLRNLVVDDLAGQAFGDGGLADAGVADQQGVVLGPAAQDLDGPLDLGVTADQGIDLAVARLFIEVDAIGFQCLTAGLGGGGVLGVLGASAGLGRALVDAASSLLGDTVGDVVDRVIAGHVLLLQEIGGVALALAEDGDQHIRARDLLAARALDVDHRALDHALEAGRGLGVLAVAGGQRRQVCVDIEGQGRLQGDQIDIAGRHHIGGVRVIDQGQQQVFKRGVFMPPLVGVMHRTVQGLFERTRK